MNGTYSVYKHTAPNGKVYIGLTCQRPEARWQKEGRGYKQQKVFWNAIQKYGWSNMQHDVLACNLSEEEAKIAEKKLIKRYRSNCHAYGYNLSSGGDLGWRGMKHTDAAKKKISASRKGVNNSMYGKKLSPEHRERLSKANRGKKKSSKTIAKMRRAQQNRSLETRKKQSDSQQKRSIICIETGEEFIGISIASKATGIPSSNLCKCCKGERHTAGGLHWKYITAC